MDHRCRLIGFYHDNRLTPRAPLGREMPLIARNSGGCTRQETHDPGPSPATSSARLLTVFRQVLLPQCLDRETRQFIECLFHGLGLKDASCAEAIVNSFLSFFPPRIPANNSSE